MNSFKSNILLDNTSNQQFINLLSNLEHDPVIKQEVILFLIVTIGNLFKIYKNIKDISRFSIQDNHNNINNNIIEISKGIKSLFENSSITLTKYITTNLKKSTINFINNNKDLFIQIDQKYN